MKKTNKTSHIIALALSIIFLASIISIKTGVASDAVRSITIKRLTLKSDAGDLDAKYKLAKLLNADMFNAKSRKRAIELTIELAEAGNLWAIHTLVPDYADNLKSQLLGKLHNETEGKYTKEEYTTYVEVPTQRFIIQTYSDLVNRDYHPAINSLLYIYYTQSKYLRSGAFSADQIENVFKSYEYWLNKKITVYGSDNSFCSQNELYSDSVALGTAYEMLNMHANALGWYVKASEFTAPNSYYATEGITNKAIATYYYFGIGTDRDTQRAVQTINKSGERYSYISLGKLHVNNGQIAEGCAQLYAADSVFQDQYHLAPYIDFCNSKIPLANVDKKALNQLVVTIKNDLSKDKFLNDIYKSQPDLSTLNLNEQVGNTPSVNNNIANIYLHGYQEIDPDYSKALKYFLLADNKEGTSIASALLAVSTSNDARNTKTAIAHLASNLETENNITKDMYGNQLLRDVDNYPLGCAWIYIANYNPISINKCNSILSSKEKEMSQEIVHDILQTQPAILRTARM